MMLAVQQTSKLDVSVLQAAVPQIVAFGRRTLKEQCVTSMAFVCLDAQANTPAVDIPTIDADLNVEVTGITRTGRLSNAKKPYGHRVTTVRMGKAVPQAVLIVMARTNPNSAYSLSTGNRWPLDLGQLPTGKGSMAARMAMINQWITRMTMARHSSTHFIQHGWSPAIRTLLSDPAYYAGKSKIRVNAQAKINPLNTLGSGDLGMATIDASGDAVLVTAENAVGEAGNPVLDEKHRAAAILHALPPAQAAIDKEAGTMLGKIQEYIDRGMKQEFPNL